MKHPFSRLYRFGGLDTRNGRFDGGDDIQSLDTRKSYRCQPEIAGFELYLKLPASEDVLLHLLDTRNGRFDGGGEDIRSLHTRNWRLVGGDRDGNGEVHQTPCQDSQKPKYYIDNSGGDVLRRLGLAKGGVAAVDPIRSAANVQFNFFAA